MPDDRERDVISNFSFLSTSDEEPAKIQPNSNMESKDEGNHITINDEMDENVPLSATKITAFDEKAMTQSEKERNGNETEDSSKELPAVPYLSLFRYSTYLDRFLILIACSAAVLSGTAMPLIFVFIGSILDSFTEVNITAAASISDRSMAENDLHFSTEMKNEFMEKSKWISIWMLLIAAGVLFLNYIMVSCLSVAAANQAFKIRCIFLKSILRQDCEWFDKNQTGDFASRITADLNRIQDGIGEKLGMCVWCLALTIFSFLFALIYGWKLTLVTLSVTPILVIAGSLIAKIQASLTGKEGKSYGKAAIVADEVLSSIRTVAAFGGEMKEVKRYEKALISAKKNGIKRGLTTGLGQGLTWACIFCSYALAFWYGSKLVVESRTENTGEYKPSSILIVFYNVLMAAMHLGQVTPYMEAFSMARAAAAQLYDVIKRTPSIDSSSEGGEKLPNLEGVIELKNVYFNYPARSDVPVLQGFDLRVAAGETIALVGPSGCGKSTVIQLIQRFYDPEEGNVVIDGYDIRNLNIGWLRDHIGVVRQEPALFFTTIAENIALGKIGATQEEIEKAAKAANAHDFIRKLPQKYYTTVGERGTQLSGGQKQRIAIARALIRNPKILLLDEATSALDTESESIVQAALDQASQGRTTLIIAHRLSTVKSADKIFVIDNGTVQECGTHSELIEKGGLYYQLVTAQQGEMENDRKIPLPKVSTSIRKLQRQESFGPILQKARSFSIRSNEIRLQDPTVTEEEEDEDLKEKPPYMRLLKEASPEWHYLLFGSLFSFLMGLAFPAHALIFGEILGTFAVADNETLQKEVSFYAALFLVLGAFAGITSFLQVFLFSLAGEHLTVRLRTLVFNKMVRQDMTWFDSPKNSTGALCSRLSSDAASVQGVLGLRMSTLCQSFSTLLTASVISLWLNWKLGLLALAAVPVVLLATFFESRIFSGQLLNEKSATENATKIAVEAIENVRTVASLHCEDTFLNKFKSTLSGPLRSVRRNSHIRGFTFGFAQSFPSIVYSLIMLYGSHLFSEGEVMFKDIFKVVEAVLTGSAVIGMAVAYAPDYQKATVAAVRIFKLLDLKPRVDAFSNDGLKPSECKGYLRFENVHFSYPSRPNVKVLSGLSLNIASGQTVALVGSSGCGKSTCVQLLERYYDSEDGELALDNNDVTSLNVSWLRSNIGIVSQEPTLFSCSISDNISYGDNSRNVSMEEVIAAARQANIHNFISTLPQGYDTFVGDKGTQLSGGQKQRIAIARALVRNPKILLLDEATSALDTESEKIVQEALDKASHGRTCITIAHRLSTIQNADLIVVINQGKVHEQGSHQDLLAKRGFFYKLHNSHMITPESHED